MWGVDSAAKVTETLLTCVRTQYGFPQFWGRYVTTVPNVSDGLTKEEIAFIRGRGIKIAPIYNAFREATQYEKGRTAARNAIFHARRLGIPKNKVIFANIEDEFQVDAAWIQAWVDTFYPSGYRPGIYANPTKGAFGAAYCEAVKNDERIAQQTIIWSSYPRPGATPAAKAPTYRPNVPNCRANVWMWQYGRDADRCAIDTNVANRKISDYLY
ncbi:DUF1906 domain-containing protein [Anoxybacillus ayderensis]|uniref:glycoside hydrolase domain-containing protein n=1 Tax=Anoxybacillus TaxID=150247 RepID=UPI0002F42F7E|nr:MULTISPECIES: glycoside hydrolase domain-containing protein [Anoxybacillus]AXM88069.1 DUF1906 domain-containing protein [Anoxybacillus ayderensis G10]MBW9217214.1 DUF1906 domain-containing protein [Anoxybacillus sp. ST70]MCQ5365688.1 DUF1906 domain-containing protein [Anoxybacillus gonensis]THD15616.1 DUF1906 domain-containing protein [Anoxybacillus ayderensis]